MLNTEYWEPENADKLLMTSKEITKLPENDLSSLLERDGALNTEEFCERLGKMAGLNSEKCFLNGKLFAMLFRITGHKIDDRPGLLAKKLIRSFLPALPNPIL